MVRTPTLLDVLRLVPSNDLTRAAKALGLSPATLMKRIEKFESALGFRLVDTASKALKPGEAGRLMIDHASRIFSQARDLTRDLRSWPGCRRPRSCSAPTCSRPSCRSASRSAAWRA